METIFDLIEVRFGDEISQARPFEFDKDENGDLIRATKAVTTCPHCGHGQEIDLIPGRTVLSAKCTNCGAGEIDYEPVTELDEPLYSSTVTVDRPDAEAGSIEDEIAAMLSDDGDDEDIAPIVPQVPAEPATPSGISTNTDTITIDDSSDVQTLKAASAFVDPIELGLFQVDEL